jgi:hypothetical protein
MDPVGAGQSLNFWIGLVTWIQWIGITLTSVFSFVNSADQFY